MSAIEFVCPHCGGEEFLKSHLFFECAECGTRYVAGVGGKLQKTDIYGHGEGSWGRRYGGEGDAESDRYGSPAATVQNVNYGTVIVNGGGAEGFSSPKRRWVALLLCLFLGALGAHYFYLGRWGMGALFLFTGGLGGVGWAFDVVRILLAGIRDADGEYAV